MKKFQNKYRIPSARASWWNYAENGAYFITICTHGRECHFGDVAIVETPNLGVSTLGTIKLSPLGEIAQHYWMEIPVHFPYIKLDAFVVMPNHIHGIIIIDKSAETIVETPKLGVSTLSNEKPGGKNEHWHKGVLGVVINQYKRICTIHCRKIQADFSWQTRFYDSIIRNTESYNTIAEYIRNNPTKWTEDRFNPSN